VTAASGRVPDEALMLNGASGSMTDDALTFKDASGTVSAASGRGAAGAGLSGRLRA
jgi:hypothetical protein